MGSPGADEVEMIERRIRARFRRGGGKAALMLGESVRVERVLARKILGVDKGLGAGDALPELESRFPPFAVAVIGVAGRCKISLRQLRPISPIAFGNPPPESDAVGARRRPEHPREAFAFESGERIVVGALLEDRDGANGGGEERDLVRKDVAEQAGNAQRYVNTRPTQHR